MILGFVEVSHESAALAEAEAISAAEALGGRGVSAGLPIPGLVAVEVPYVAALAELGGRLALARRCLTALPTPDGPVEACRREGASGGSAAFRRIGRPSGGDRDEEVLDCGRAFKSTGGAIDLERPSRRFWLARGTDGHRFLLQEIAAVDRRAASRRRMPLLPFRRPISLPPRLARAAVNLARVTPADRVLDPFLGTGALLAEAGLLGSRLYGIDRDPDMVRGALQNLTYLGVAADELVVGDARSVDFADSGQTFQAIVTDPPYGRSSSTGGEASAELTERVLERWCQRLEPEGRMVAIVPAGGRPLDLPGTLRFRIPVRVHRSLTREFRVYEHAGVKRSSSPRS
ncbi:MAG TPA: methyltransferase domain-containing protein [Thermoplasmata archaeon]|nr:methyltransferase domain-containing protein [Thermoplasmata archaeon]